MKSVLFLDASGPLVNLTLQNSQISNNEGVGFLYTNGVDVTISNSEWRNNTFQNMIAFNLGTVSVTDSNFTLNGVGSLGGMYLSEVKAAQISNCRISQSHLYQNSVGNGFLVVHLTAMLNITDCTFDANAGMIGGSAGLFDSTVNISHSLFM
jgi:hypothetical protein